MKRVRKIEVSQKNIIRELRVAAYCRVSTKYESQKSRVRIEGNKKAYVLKAIVNEILLING